MKTRADERPSVVERLGNGAYYYNYDVVETTEEREDGQHTVYTYNYVKIWGRPSYKVAVKAVIREEVSETEEFGIVNDYNAVTLGVLEGDEAAEAVNRYKSYLNRLYEIKRMVKTDLPLAGEE